MPRLCLIEDDPIMGESLVDRFTLEGYTLDWHRSGQPALDALSRHQYDAVISDVRLPDLSGEDVFFQAQRAGTPVPPFLFITAYASVERAVQMLKCGATDYVTKPFDIGELVNKVSAIVGSVDIAIVPSESSAASLGVSASMRRLAALAPRVAARARTVLLCGESGSGKEVLARHLHELANAGLDGRFVAVNCGAIPESLLEDALFGHEKGAFTGADRPARGYFEQAVGGTLFLDEISELTPSMQVKLLRVIQERSVQRLGAELPVPVDLRVICATHAELLSLVASGRFREDLYYRIAVVQLDIPPLRSRIEDVPWLAQRFVADLAPAAGEPRVFHPCAMAALLAHHWPGNVRELRNRIERAYVMSEGPLIYEADLFPEREDTSAPDSTGVWPTLEQFIFEAERGYLQAALRRADGRIGATAAALGISRKTLWDKMRRHKLSGLDE